MYTLGAVESYAYTAHAGVATREESAIDGGDEFERVLDAMEILRFSDSDRDGVRLRLSPPGRHRQGRSKRFPKRSAAGLVLLSTPLASVSSAMGLLWTFANLRLAAGWVLLRRILERLCWMCSLAGRDSIAPLP